MNKNEKAPDVSKYLGLGVTWTLSTLLFLWLGSLADKWLHTQPVLTFVGAFVGGGAGFYYMYRSLTESTRAREKARREGESSQEKK